jgi:hypothetical protein
MNSRIMTLSIVFALCLCSFADGGDNHWDTTITDNPTSSGSDSADQSWWNPIFGTCCWTTSSHTKSSGSSSCSVTVIGDVSKHTLHFGSLTANATASAGYDYQKTVVWHGPDPAPCRMLSFTATGGGSEGVSVGCAADQGSSASCSATGSGACSSLGNANATINMHSLSLSAQYDSAESEVDLSGNADINGQISDNSAQVGASGWYHQSGSWSVEGEGSASGSASYTVLSTRQYNATTDSGYTQSRSGNVQSNGNCGCSSGGAADFSGSSQLNLSV